MPLANSRMEQYPFLQDMYEDDYFPDGLVKQVETILRALCERIEAEKPADLAALYALSAVATEEINALEEAFEAADSEIETVARDTICGDILAIAHAHAYGYDDADNEALTTGREW